MNSHLLGANFPVEATARSTARRLKVSDANGVIFSAVTFAKPKSTVLLSMADFYGKKPTETLTSKVLNFWHNAVVFLKRAVWKLSCQSHHSDEGEFREQPLGSISVLYDPI